MRRNADDPSERTPTSKPGASRPSAAKTPANQPETAPAARRQATLASGLYLVATPIGNLGDITRRAIDVLSNVDVIAAEDTRVTRRLLAALGLPAPHLVRYDDHAGEAERARLIKAIEHGKTVALVSDAGMPLVADPGLKLVRAVQAAGYKVTSVPGPSAALAALAVSGLPSDRFLFTGFLPVKDGARRRALAELAAVPATLIVFEAPQRLAVTVTAMAETLGDREAAVVRELTKLFEEVRRGSLRELAAALDPDKPPKGEIVIVVAPPGIGQGGTPEAEIEQQLAAALATMSVRDAVAAVAAATNRKRGDVYALALRLKSGLAAADGADDGG